MCALLHRQVSQGLKLYKSAASCQCANIIFHYLYLRWITLRILSRSGCQTVGDDRISLDTGTRFEFFEHAGFEVVRVRLHLAPGNFLV